MEREITALLPRGPQTAVLPVPRGTLRCWDCQWLDTLISRGELAYAGLLASHWSARHGAR